MNRLDRLLNGLNGTSYTDEDLAFLIGLSDSGACQTLYDKAFETTTRELGNSLYFRGLIEISNVCTYDCLYCGIRKSNHAVKRFTLTVDEIVEAARLSFEAGYGSVALQSGERDDPKFIDFIADAIRGVVSLAKERDPQSSCGITLSFGEQAPATYEKWKEAAGETTALRYLLRLETSNLSLFKHLHDSGRGRRKTLVARYMALDDLRQAGYQVGTGMMIGIPGQSIEDLVCDLRAFQRIDPDMFGMGPYLVSQGGGMVDEGMMERKRLLQLTRNTIATTRLLFPHCNIAAATALETLVENGRCLGVLSGCNVIMPNVSPERAIDAYALYDRKAQTETGMASNRALEQSLTEMTGRTIAYRTLGSSLRFQERTTAV